MNVMKDTKTDTKTLKEEKMLRENSGQWEAVFKVNGEEWMSYTQAPDETYDDFEDEVFQIEVELTREAYREFKTRNVTVEIVERRKK